MRILLIEDHPDLAANVGDYLTSLGHVVDFAADGKAGYSRAQAQEHDVIVLDRMLPGLDGARIARQLRAAGHATPILMLTALDAVSDRVDGLTAGADDYLVKPFAMAELAARISALHRRSSGAVAEQVLRIADLEFNTGTAEVRRGGQLVNLTRAERRLLELLLRRAPKLASRVECEHALWGDDAPDGDVLRAHMHNLRNAVDKPFPKKLIHTVHGEGYRIAELND